MGGCNGDSGIVRTGTKAPAPQAVKVAPAGAAGRAAGAARPDPAAACYFS
jgi:hypothetical protein